MILEEPFGEDLFVDMLNGASKPPAAKIVTTASLRTASPTPRIVKKAEALFKLMPASVAEFNHFGAARWLLENPSVLDADTPAVNTPLTDSRRCSRPSMHCWPRRNDAFRKHCSSCILGQQPESTVAP